MKALLAVVVLAGLTAAAYRFVQADPAAWEHLRKTSLESFAAMVTVLFLVMACNGLLLRDVVGHFGVRPGLRQCLGITFVTSVLNLVTPIRGGAAVRAAYLKHAHGLPYTRFASTLATSLAFSFLVNAALAGCCILLLGVPGGAQGWTALATCAGVVVAVGAALWWAPAVPAQRGALAARLAGVAEGWRTMSRDRGLLVRVLFWTTMNALGHSIVFVLAFRSVGWAGSPVVPVTSSAFAKIGGGLAITPAGLGIYEAFGAVSARIVGAGMAESVLAVVVVRILSVATAIIGAALLWPTLLSAEGEKKG